MEVASIRHKALRRFVETGVPKGLPSDLAERLLKMVNFLIVAETLDELAMPPNYGLHALKGARAGSWAMTLNRNWRLTFAINEDDAIVDLDLEDYH